MVLGIIYTTLIWRTW